MKEYTHGDVVRLSIELEDETGVDAVEAWYNRRLEFGQVDHNRVLQLRGHGGGEKRANVELSAEVTDNFPPGEYVCGYIQAYDSLNNPMSQSNPGAAPRFRVIERGHRDHEGPSITNIGPLQ